MDGKLGYKSMLRRWRINLKQKKLKFMRKHYKITSLFYSMIVILIMPFGYIFNSKTKINKELEAVKNSKDKLKELDKVEQKFNQMDKSNLSVKEANEIISKINEIKQEELDKMYSKKTDEKSNTKDKVIELDKKIDALINKKTIANSTVKEPKKDVISNLTKENNTVSLNNSIVKEPKKDVTLPNDLIMPSIINKIDENKELDKTEDICKLVSSSQMLPGFIKLTTKQLEKYEEQIKNIEDQIKKNNKYNDYYTYEFDLKYINDKLNRLHEKYLEFGDFNKEIELKFDKYELLKSDKKFIELNKQIEEDLKQIELNKLELLNKKETETKKEEKKVEKKEVKKEEQKINENIIANKQILTSIKNQEEIIEKYLCDIQNTSNKKNTLLSYLNRMSYNIVLFTSALFPFNLFNNRFLNTLVTNILINNSLKTMNRMFHPELHINYRLIKSDCKNMLSILTEIKEVCYDSLNEIAKIRNELNMLNIDDNELLNELDLIEEHFNKQLNKSKNKTKKVDKILTKIN